MGKWGPFSFLFFFFFETNQEAPDRQTEWLKSSANVYMYRGSACVSLRVHGPEGSGLPCAFGECELFKMNRANRTPPARPWEVLVAAASAKSEGSRSAESGRGEARTPPRRAACAPQGAAPPGTASAPGLPVGRGPTVQRPSRDSEARVRGTAAWFRMRGPVPGARRAPRASQPHCPAEFGAQPGTAPHTGSERWAPVFWRRFPLSERFLTFFWNFEHQEEQERKKEELPTLPSGLGSRIAPLPGPPGLDGDRRSPPPRDCKSRRGTSAAAAPAWRRHPFPAAGARLAAGWGARPRARGARGAPSPPSPTAPPPAAESGSGDVGRR